MPAIPAPPPAPEPMPPADRYQVTQGINDLNGRLCRAVGLDPDGVAGFELVVRGGEMPTLAVYALPDIGTDGTLDPYSAPLGEAMRSATAVLLPGSDTTAPLVRHTPAYLPLGATPPAEVQADVAAVLVLRLMADVLNGAGCDDTTRAWATEAARNLAEDFEGRILEAALGVPVVGPPPSLVPEGGGTDA